VAYQAQRSHGVAGGPWPAKKVAWKRRPAKSCESEKRNNGEVISVAASAAAKGNHGATYRKEKKEQPPSSQENGNISWRNRNAKSYALAMATKS